MTSNKRLMKEAADLTRENLEWCTVEPTDNILLWNATLLGPENSPYAERIFNIELHFPDTYPFKAPVVKFITKTYHPSVKTDSGEICQGMIGDNWAPTLNIKYVLQVIKQMLENPEETAKDSPVETEIANLVLTNKEEFEKMAKAHTQKYAC